MNQRRPAVDEYHAQVIRCAQALARARNEPIGRYLPDAGDLQRVKMFTDGNLDKRLWKLQDQLDFLSDAFADLDDLFARYIREVPLAAYDTGSVDCGRFLDWLCGGCTLTAEQADFVTCQKGRLAVESLAAKNRLGHVRFQELWALAAQFARDVQLRPNLWVHLNPIHAWGRFFTTALLEEDDESPATVMFFPVGNDIRTAVLEGRGLELVSRLETLRPCRVSQLSDGAGRPCRRDVQETLHELATVGLAAFG